MVNTDVYLFCLCANLGHLLLTRRAIRQRLEVLLDRFDTPNMGGHLHQNDTQLNYR